MHGSSLDRYVKMGLMALMGTIVAAGAAAAQSTPNAPTENNVYCTEVATPQAIPSDAYVISGENSGYKIVFAQGDLVYINRGADKGVKVGDEFEVLRSKTDSVQVSWFKWQPELLKAMGTMYSDRGRIVVVNVHEKTSTARVKLSCELMQRGDIIRPFQARPIPAFHDAALDPFAKPSGKKTAMVVTTKDFGEVAGNGETVFVNLGSDQGVRIGDYFRVFRYQGTRDEMLYQEHGLAYKAYGWGSTPVAYEWNDVPRQVLGEGIVLRVGPNAATVLLTTAMQEIYDGDYVELE